MGQLVFSWFDGAERADSAPKPGGTAATAEALRPQREEFPRWDPAPLQTELTQESGLPVRVLVTNNARTVLTLKPAGSGDGVSLRLHHMFLSAGPAVRKALATWIQRPKSQKAGAVIDQYIREHKHLVRAAAKRHVRLCPKGVHFDLDALFEEENLARFDGQVNARITWGQRNPTRRRQRSIRFGSYSADDHLIRIHPCLDRDFVPAYFVRFIVFHEMLHAYLGIEETPSGRRRIHSPEFKRIEQSHPDYRRAVAWEETPRNMRKLLRR
jgi:hypothetical protein